MTQVLETLNTYAANHPQSPLNMPGDDVKDHAINSSHDFYELLEVSPSAADAEIRRAYRKTALKYHPDKVGANDLAAREKFDILQIAYEILSDPDVRQLYDNARRAREEKKLRESAYDGRRKQLKDDLERRERAGLAGLKRPRDETSREEEAFQREVKRLAADGARRRKEREELLRKEAREAYEREQSERGHSVESPTPVTNGNGAADQDRTIKLRFPAELGIQRDELLLRFSHFGQIDDVVLLPPKKVKVDGEKHRKEYITGMLVFNSIVGAHAAVTDFPDLKERDSTAHWSIFEQVNWLAGRQPDCIPTVRSGLPRSPEREEVASPAEGPPRTPSATLQKDHSHLRKVPSFGSFKGSPKTASPAPAGSPSMAELTRIRLKNAERRRLSEMLRQEEEQEERNEAKEDAAHQV